MTEVVARNQLSGANAVAGPQLYEDTTPQFAPVSNLGSVLLVELYFDGGYHLQRVATDWWYSQSTDSIGVQEWADRVIAEPTYSVQLGCVAWASKTSVSVGSIEVADPAGDLDWMQRKTRDQLCVLRLANHGQSYDQTRIVGRAIVDSVEMSGTSKIVRLRGIDTLLDRPLQTTLYAAPGSTPTSSEDDNVEPANDATRNTAIEGERVPIVLGRVWQAEPTLTSTADLRFQLADAGIVEINEVLSGGSVALPPDSSDEEWDYANLRTGFRMTVTPAARITANVDGIRALTAAIISDQFNFDVAFSSNGLADWTETTSTSGQAVVQVVDVGVQLTADAGEVSGPSIARTIAASEYDWVVILVDVLDISDGHLTVSIGTPVEIRREGRHALILPMGAGTDIEIAGVPDATGCDVTIGSVYAYLLQASAGTESLVEMMRHITIARGALPDADEIVTQIISAGSGDFDTSGDLAEWDQELTGVANADVTGGAMVLSAGDGATNSAARVAWPDTLVAGGRYQYSVDVDNTTITGRAGFAGVQVFFRPTSLIAASYIRLGFKTTVGATTYSGTFEPTEAGQFVIECIAGDQETAVTEVDNITLARLEFGDDGATVDFDSLAGIDDGYQFGLVARESATVREAATQLLDSICGWMYPDPDGRIRFGRLAEPTGAPSLTISRVNMRSRPVFAPDLAPGLSDTIGGARNWSPYSDSELAGITYPNRPPYRAEFRARRRGASAESLARPYTHAVGAESIPTLIYDDASTQAEADRLTALYTTQRGFWQVDVALASASEAAQMRPDMTVALDDPLFGDDDGKLCRVVGVEGKYRSQVVSLTLWGAVSG